MKQITFIGLGNMGTAMVERLLAANFLVTVYNRSPEKAAPLVSLGAHQALTLEEAVKDADIVLSSLLNDVAVLTVSADMLPFMRQGAVHIGLSTVLPNTAEQLLDLHREFHIDYVSAVVLGVPDVARKGEMTSFYSSKTELMDTVQSLLGAFANNIIPLGDEDQIKAPNLIKICMNYSLMTTIELISELYVFAEKSGLDTDVVKTGLQQIYGHPAFRLYVEKIHERNFDKVNFTMAGGNKDVKLFQEAFAQAGVTPHLANLSRSRFIAALAQGMGDKDWSGVYEVVRKDAGLE